MSKVKAPHRLSGFNADKGLRFSYTGQWLAKDVCSF